MHRNLRSSSVQQPQSRGSVDPGRLNLFQSLPSRPGQGLRGCWFAGMAGLLRSLAFLWLVSSGVACSESAKGGGQQQAASQEDMRAAEKLATTTLAASLKVAAEEIRIVHVAQANWPDSSLGCAIEGMQYTQVVTPGFRATLQHGKQAYRVHMGGGRALLCNQAMQFKRTYKSRKKSQKFTQRQVELLTQADLGRRLGIPPNDSVVAKTTSVQWKDESLGCPQAGQRYSQGPIAGYVVKLAYQGVEYTYHTDEEHVLPCPPIAAE